MYLDNDPRRTFTFTVTRGNVTATCGIARYAKGKMSIHLTENPYTGFRTFAHYLLETLNAGYSHRSGYLLSPNRSAQFRALFVEGWSAKSEGRKIWGISPDQKRRIPLKEALKEIAAQVALSA